jgi:ornithine cyclodeaminase/alanine dehydrogenase-like protein (mu-crystallin family)
MKDPARILTRADVRRLAGVDDHYAAAREAFLAAADGRVRLPPPMEIAGAGGAFHAKGAAMEWRGRRLAALKFNANFPDNPVRRGLPTIQGAILLSDADSGAPLAIMDSIELTLRRTAAASALAVEALARRSAETLLICGCGEQGFAHAEALAHRRTFSRILAFDLDAEKVSRFCGAIEERLGLPASAAANFDEAARAADVIVAVTTARRPFLFPEHVRRGAMIAAVGADNPQKNEIAPSLLAISAVVADVRDQCLVMGDLRAAVAAGAMGREAVRAELSAVVAGVAEGRTSEDEIIVFDSTGAAFQDVAAAAMIYERACDANVGIGVNLND